MTKVLTAKAVEAMKPGAARREIPDGAVVGLYLIMQPSGAKAWALRYRAPDPRKLTLGRWPAMGLAEARTAARAALGHVSEGGDPAADRKAEREARASGRDTVRALFEDYRRRKLKLLKAGDQPARMIERLMLPTWGDRRVQAISRRDAIELIEGVAERTPVTANRLKAYGAAFFAWLVARDVLGTNPFEGVKATRETSRERVLSDDEVRLLWKATERVGYPFGPLARILLLTGQRLGEVAGLCWAELDGDVWRLPAERVKNGLAHVVPLSAAVLAELEALPRIAGGYVFTTTGRTPVSGYDRAIRRLRSAMAEVAAEERGDPVTIAAWGFHDLRRTFATGCAALGVPVQTAEAVLNHVSGSRAGVAGVYNRHDYGREARAALDRWAAHVAGLVQERPANVVRLQV